MLQAGTVQLTDLAWHEELPEWKPLHTLLGIPQPARSQAPPGFGLLRRSRDIGGTGDEIVRDPVLDFGQFVNAQPPIATRDAGTPHRFHLQGEPTRVGCTATTMFTLCRQ